MNTYKVKVLGDYPTNDSDAPFVDNNEFDSLDEAQDFLQDLDEESHYAFNEGLNMIAQLFEIDDIGNEFLLAEKQIPPAPLPADCILVFYKHVKYMNYAFDIEEVRRPDWERTYADLPVHHDRTNTTWCAVYDCIDHLAGAFEFERGIFEKIHSGAHLVDNFIYEFDNEG